MAEKSIVLIGNAWGTQFHIPGFVRIDKLRQVGEDRGEYFVIYDDANLADVAHVRVSAAFNGDLPPAGSIPLGRVYSEIMPGFGHIYYELETSVPPYVETFAMAVGAGFGSTSFYVKGFVSVDHVEAVDEWGRMDIVVQYKPNEAGANIRRVSIHSDVKPSNFGGVDSSGLIGVRYKRGLPEYVQYTTKIVPATP